MKILITGANTAIALKLLKAFEGIEVILADYGDVPSLKTSQYEFKTLGIKNEDTVAHQLLSFCLDNAIDLLLPLRQFEQLPVAKTEVLFNEFNIQLLLPEMNQIGGYQTNEKSSAIAVLQEGKLVFTNIDGLNLADLRKLSGAFYIGEEQKLSLIAIA